MMYILLLMFSLMQAQVQYVDFDVSMGIQDHPSILDLDFSRKMYRRTQALYEVIAEADEQKKIGAIPRVIHHVWFGLPVSEEDKQLRATWEQHHPDPWQFVLWTDRVDNDPRAVVAYTWQEVEDLLAAGYRSIVVDVQHLEFPNRVFFDETPYYGERSDILKWEIVYRLGGMYCDFDFKCLASFDEIHDQYDFYSGLQPLDTGLVQLGAALFAAKPHHPILEHAVKTIPLDRKFEQIVIKTGPIHFSKSVFAVAGTFDTRDIVFPASYFYPCGYAQQDQPEEQWRKPESLAVHMWAGSWLKPEAIAPSGVSGQ